MSRQPGHSRMIINIIGWNHAPPGYEVPEVRTELTPGTLEGFVSPLAGDDRVRVARARSAQVTPPNGWERETPSFLFEDFCGRRGDFCG